MTALVPPNARWNNSVTRLNSVSRSSSSPISSWSKADQKGSDLGTKSGGGCGGGCGCWKALWLGEVWREREESIKKN